MKYYGKITDSHDLATKGYVDEHSGNVDIFIATIGTTTETEINTAISAGKTIIAKDVSGCQYNYSVKYYISGEEHPFFALYIPNYYQPYERRYYVIGSTWDYNIFYVGEPSYEGYIDISSTWSGSASPYSQSLDFSVDERYKYDFAYNPSIIAQMKADGCTSMYIENVDGVATLYATGKHPTVAFEDVLITKTPLHLLPRFSFE